MNGQPHGDLYAAWQANLKQPRGTFLAVGPHVIFLCPGIYSIGCVVALLRFLLAQNCMLKTRNDGCAPMSIGWKEYATDRYGGWSLQPRVLQFSSRKKTLIPVSASRPVKTNSAGGWSPNPKNMIPSAPACSLRRRANICSVSYGKARCPPTFICGGCITSRWI